VTSQTAVTAEREAGSGYLVGPFYDCLFLIYSPLLAVVLGIGVSYSRYLTLEPIWLHERWVFRANLAIGTLIAAHLVLVLVRSHANPEVFKRHTWRFTLVPLALFFGLFTSIWLSVFVSVLAVWWDLYHSSMQTFGLCRLYERKAGNGVEVGRGLDMGLNLLLYVGPILGGATLANHLKFFDRFERVGSAFFTAIPAQVQSVHRELTWIVLVLGSVFLAYYVYAYWRLAQAGHKVSTQKILLLVSTGFCSITTWGFNSFGQAFFIMNFFHAIQYFAIVWWIEGGNLSRLLRWEGRRWAPPVLLGLFVLVPLGYGLLVTIPQLNTNNALFCLAMVITIMHFWYDGFIWSVRKSHV